ncbi:phosphotransferase family protein [Sphaerisporangium corydalis]|uniref:Phosphotransferase family protein n=1 Tax=Sphaerisporangium corydalis TaxID=1441875 RepID=A0ABV9ER87_9ACTN|nr:phosphotransferase family protein [Sphaerisporangium corydalis]
MSRLEDQHAVPAEMRTSTRDLGELRERLRAWLPGRLDGASAVTVSELSRPSGNGLSSETVFFTATWAGASGEQELECVARLAPAADAVPVFPEYDLGRQFEVMRLARQRAGIPAPLALWFEPDPGPLGSPFFVMERERGDVPPDLVPYTFQGWLLDASPADRARLQAGTVDVLARLHNASVRPGELDFLRSHHPGDSALRRHVTEQRAYYEWAHSSMRVPILEDAFLWLEDHWPAGTGPDVINWGDARIGNVMYRDFTPVAVLDWEMAGVGPREIDLAWMFFLHRFFQDVATFMELPGLPGFMTRDDVCAQYHSMSGYEPRDMEFYEMYAALRYGIIMARVCHRQIHFGERAMPDDPNDLVMHRATIESMLEGDYWD